MNFYSAFNIPLNGSRAQGQKFGPEIAAGGDNGGGQTGAVGAFITTQSLVSFSGATGVIYGMWSAVKTLFAVPPAYGVWIIFALSFLVGSLIYYMNISDPNAKSSRRDMIIGGVIAFLNVLVIFNASRALAGAAP